MSVASHEFHTAFEHNAQNAHKRVAGFISDLNQRYREADTGLTDNSQSLWKNLKIHAESNLKALKSTLSRLSVYSAADFKSLEGAVKRTEESLEAYQEDKGLDYVGWLARAPQVLAERLEARELLRSSESTCFTNASVLKIVAFQKLKIQILESSDRCYSGHLEPPPNKAKEPVQTAPASKAGVF